MLFRPTTYTFAFVKIARKTVLATFVACHNAIGNPVLFPNHCHRGKTLARSSNLSIDIVICYDLIQLICTTIFMCVNRSTRRQSLPSKTKSDSFV